jgi:hypothetical protein
VVWSFEGFRVFFQRLRGFLWFGVLRVLGYVQRGREGFRVEVFRV